MIRDLFHRYGPALLGVLVGILVVGVIVVLGQIRMTQVDHSPEVENGSAAAKAAARGTARIEDCTTPGRQCFDDGQKRLAGTIADLISNNQRAAAAAAACAANLDVVNFQTVYACELRSLADRKQR